MRCRNILYEIAQKIYLLTYINDRSLKCEGALEQNRKEEATATDRKTQKRKIQTEIR